MGRLRAFDALFPGRPVQLNTSRRLWETFSHIPIMSHILFVHKYPPLYIARKSSIQLSKLEPCSVTQLGQRSKRQVERPLFYLLPHRVPLSSNEASGGRRTQGVDRSSRANRVDTEDAKPSPVPAGRGERDMDRSDSCSRPRGRHPTGTRTVC